MSDDDSGLLGSSSKDPVEVQESVPLVIEKHNRALLVADLTDRTVHAAWPIYTHQAAIEDRQALSDGVWMCAKRTTTSVGPGDTFVVTVQVRSQRVDPVKLGRLELVLREVVTFRGDLTGPKAGAGAGEQRTRDVVDTKLACKQALYTNELHSFDIQGQLPPQHSLVTVSTAKHISIAYSLRIRAHIERTAGTTAATSDVVIDQMATTVSSFPRQHGTAVVAKMMANAGPIPAFLDEPGNPSARQSTVSPHRSFASYDPRMSVIGSPSMPGLAVVGATPRMPSLSSRGSIGPSAPSLASHSSSHGSIYGGMAPSRSDTGSSHVPAPNPALYSDEPIGQLRSRTPASFAVEAAKQRLKSQAYVANRTDDDADDPYGLRDFEAPASDKLARERQRALVTLTSASASTSPAPPAVDGHWQSAEEEKARLFKAAVAQRAATTAATSSSAASSSTAFESAGAEQARLVATYASPPASTSTASSPTPSSNSHSRWMSAEEEKARLHAQALAAHAAHANGPVEPSSPVAASSAPRHGKKRSDTNATISGPCAANVISADRIHSAHVTDTKQLLVTSAAAADQLGRIGEGGAGGQVRGGSGRLDGRVWRRGVEQRRELARSVDILLDREAALPRRHCRARADAARARAAGSAGGERIRLVAGQSRIAADGRIAVVVLCQLAARLGR